VDLSDRTVLVIGGAGYVGSVLVPCLLQAGAHVRVLDQLIYDNGSALIPVLDNPRVQFYRGDLRSEDTLTHAGHGATDVVLLAALVGDQICNSYPKLTRAVNVIGGMQVVDRLDELAVTRFVFTSTCSNYGIQDISRLSDEKSQLNPQSLYARTKIALEEYILTDAKKRACATTVLRIGTAYGLSPRMRFDLTVSQFAWELAMGRSLDVYDADTWRPYCHVKDISKAVMTVLTAPKQHVRGQVFNVGDNAQQFTKRMVVDEVRKHLGEVSVSYVAHDSDPRNYRVSFEKIAHRLGFCCDYAMQDHVPRLVHAVQAGVFPNVSRNPRFGNYSIRDLAPDRAGHCG
jgi:nucleoside-diphosphate-sugar epimerase